MAEVVKALPKEHKAPNWVQYLDGQIWKLSQGTDYGSASAAQNALRGAAKYHNKRVKIRVRDKGKVLYVQARDKQD